MDPRATLQILENEGRDPMEVLKDFAERLVRQQDQIKENEKIIENLGRVLKRTMRATVRRPYSRRKENGGNKK